MVFLLVGVIIGAVVFVKKRTAAVRAGPQAFDNPLYESATGQQHPGVPKYADFSAEPAGSSGYMDVAPGGMQQSSGYMDVAPHTDGGSAGSGYMDVSADSQGGFDDDAEEDV